MFKSTKIIISIATLALIGMFAFYQGAQTSDISSGLFLAAAPLKNTTAAANKTAPVPEPKNKTHPIPPPKPKANHTAPGQAKKNITIDNSTNSTAVKIEELAAKVNKTVPVPKNHTIPVKKNHTAPGQAKKNDTNATADKKNTTASNSTVRMLLEEFKVVANKTVPVPKNHTVPVKKNHTIPGQAKKNDTNATSAKIVEDLAKPAKNHTVPVKKNHTAPGQAKKNGTEPITPANNGKANSTVATNSTTSVKIEEDLAKPAKNQTNNGHAKVHKNTTAKGNSTANKARVLSADHYVIFN